MARTPITSPDTPGPSREDEVLIREIDEAVREDALCRSCAITGSRCWAACSR
jgi:hypothetical protein